MLRQTSRADTVSSCQSGSVHRVHLITEASSVLPSLSISAFSLDFTDASDEAPSVVRGGEILGHTNRFEEGLSSSCKDGLDVFDDPNYTDTVKSTDSTGSFLRRSMSVPPKYTYKGQTRRHVFEVFEDFIVNDDNVEEDKEESPKTWRQTMEDLLERPDYVDSLQSTSSGTALLAKSAIQITQKGTQAQIVLDEKQKEIKRKKDECHMYIKNLIVLSTSFFFVFGSYLSLRNLQSSINSDSALALYSLSALYLCFFLGCICATTIIQFLRPKNTMLIGISIILIYLGTNFYPTYYTLLPASLLVGLALASIWTAHSTYLASIALSYAKTSGKNPNLVLAKFNGIFFMLFGVSQVFGNIISSTVLMNQSDKSGNDDKNNFAHLEGHVSGNMTFTNYSASAMSTLSNSTSSILNLFTYIMGNISNSGVESTLVPLLDDLQQQPQCGIKYIRPVRSASTPSSSGAVIDRHIIFILLSIFVVSILTGMAILSFCLDRLDGEIKRSSKSVGHQLVSVFSWFNDYRVLCLIPLMFYSLIQIAFIFGEFSMAFVTCPMGVYMVGYSMVALSVFTSLSSYINGKIVKHVGRPPVIIIAGLTHFVLLMTMLFWKPTAQSTVVLLVYMGIWGIGDGIWLTQVVSIIGVIFSDNKEPAFAGLKMCQSLGACLTLATAEYISFEIKVYIIASLLVVSMICYLILEVSLWRQDKKKEAEVMVVTVDTNNGPTSV